MNVVHIEWCTTAAMCFPVWQPYEALFRVGLETDLCVGLFISLWRVFDASEILYTVILDIFGLRLFSVILAATIKA